MSFDINYFTAITPRKKGAITIYTYDASAVGDSIADVTTANYFPVGGLANVDIEPQDTVHVYATDGPYEVQLVGGVASVVSSPIFNIQAMGADKTGSVDASDIIIKAFQAASENLGAVYIPAGEYLVTKSLGKYTKAFKIYGDGPTKSVIKLDPDMTGWALEFKETGFVVSGWTRDDDTIIYNNEVSGVTLNEFSIVGDRTNSAAQGGVRFLDRNDNISFKDFWVQFCSLGGFDCGILEDRTVAYIRESDFYNLQVRMCGDRTNPAMRISAAGSGDATNQVNFYGLKVVWPFGEALQIENESTANEIRRLYFYGCMLHGQEVAVGTGKDLGAIIGDISAVNFYGLRCNSAESGAFSLAIRQDGSGNYPTDVFAQISVTNAHGGGVYIEGGRKHRIVSDGILTDENELEIDSGVDGFITIENAQDSWSTSIDANALAKWVSTHYSEVDIPARFERIKLGSDSLFQPEIIPYAGTPEGNVSGPSGSLVPNRQGSAERNSDQLWSKFSGTGATGWYAVQFIVAGTTAQRPSSPTDNQMYIDTTIGKPIWYIGGAWVDATGAAA
jgi:hypothetical protein